MYAADWPRIVLWFDLEFFVHECVPLFSINLVWKSRILSVRADCVTRHNARATGSLSFGLTLFSRAPGSSNLSPEANVRTKVMPSSHSRSIL
jgi:hypothetical protein